ncbi:hypothetical protein AMECASPLE_020843 [Ameca splendens]|uniref:Uncharacterized protein n=1 Tax=Ameca splendens TaxID=208324 RepID=A0ABV0Z1P5_9TELE
MVLTHRHCSEEGPAETLLPAATQVPVQSSILPLFSQSCLCPSLCGLAHSQNRTGPDCNKQLGLQKESSGLTFPPSRTCTSLGSENKASLQTPHIMVTGCLDFNLQSGATESRWHKPATTKTVSSPRLSL